jgi:hypothetical protein
MALVLSVVGSLCLLCLQRAVSAIRSADPVAEHDRYRQNHTRGDEPSGCNRRDHRGEANDESDKECDDGDEERQITDPFRNTDEASDAASLREDRIQCRRRCIHSCHRRHVQREQVRRCYSP